MKKRNFFKTVTALFIVVAVIMTMGSLVAFAEDGLYLSDLTPTSATEIKDPSSGAVVAGYSADSVFNPYNGSGNTLLLKGTEYTKGIGLIPYCDRTTGTDINYDAEVEFDISQYSDSYDTFTATVGRRDWPSDPGPTVYYMVCSVYVDDVLVLECPSLSFGEQYEICVNIAGATKLKLVTNKGAYTEHYDCSIWANAKLTKTTVTEIFLSDLTPMAATEIKDPASGAIVAGYTANSVLNPYNGSGTSLKLQGKIYSKGVGLIPYCDRTTGTDINYDAEVEFDISQYSDSYDTFTATVGRRDWPEDVGGAVYSMICSVYVDDVLVVETPSLTFGEVYEININISGASKIKLVTNKGTDTEHYDCSIWGDAKLTDVIPNDTPNDTPDNPNTGSIDTIGSAMLLLFMCAAAGLAFKRAYVK
ncbi:MAG: hypothetical protein E7385_06470 [Ruminococcaceae bacterium]|nr:hypothetical protein [Oscillospiraceae bacterium]